MASSVRIIIVSVLLQIFVASSIDTYDSGSVSETAEMANFESQESSCLPVFL